MASKRMRVSPVKGTDKCAACEDNLNEGSNAMNCDDCERWLCAECLDLSEPEYILLTKMTRHMGCEWKCPMCKGNPKGSVNASEIAKIVDSSIKRSLGGLDDTIKNLDVKIKEAVKDSFLSLKDELKAEIDTKFTGLEDRVRSLEQHSGAATDQKVLKDLVTAETTALKEALNEQFESRVKALIFEDRDRQKRRLNIVAFGVATQTDDAQFVREHLANEYGLPGVPISNIRRLVNPTVSVTQNPLRPPPIMFAVPNFKIKKLILQKSFEKKGAVQFRNDVSKTDRDKRQKLYEELYRRRAGGESNIVIKGNKIVPKNFQQPPATLGLQVMEI